MRKQIFFFIFSNSVLDFQSPLDRSTSGNAVLALIPTLHGGEPIWSGPHLVSAILIWLCLDYEDED